MCELIIEPIYYRPGVSSEHCLSQTVSAMNPTFRVTCHMSFLMCQVSGVTCQVSHVTCHMSGAFFLQSGRACLCRVCYKRGLPHQVSETLNRIKQNKTHF